MVEYGDVKSYVLIISWKSDFYIFLLKVFIIL